MTAEQHRVAIQGVPAGAVGGSGAPAGIDTQQCNDPPYR